MFVGNPKGSIDTKGRIIIPAKFRHEFGDSCILEKGIDNCIFIYKKDVWLEYAKKHVPDRTDEDELTRNLQFSFFSGVEDREVDLQGRVNMPEGMINHAGIAKEIVFMGCMDRIAVWSKENYDAKIEDPAMSQKELLDRKKEEAKKRKEEKKKRQKREEAENVSAI